MGVPLAADGFSLIPTGQKGQKGQSEFGQIEYL